MSDNRNINTDAGNYNENIEGNYIQGNSNTQITYQIQKAAKGVINFAREMGNSIPYFINYFLPEESEEEIEKMIVYNLLQREIYLSELKEFNLQSSTKYFNEILLIEEANLEEERRHNQLSEEIDLQRLHLQAIELKFQIEHYEKQIELKEKDIKINESKILLEKKSLEIERQTLEIRREWQHQQLKIKSEEIQGLWDANNSSLILSPQDTKSFFIKQHQDCDLFIFFSPLEISEESEFSKISINEELEHDLDACFNNFNSNSQLGNHTKFYRIFKRPITKLEAEDFINKYSPIPIVIFYGAIINHKLYIKISYLQKTASIEFDLKEIYRELVISNSTVQDIIYLVKDFLIDFYKITVLYIVDLYYIYIKYFHELRLPQLLNSLLPKPLYQGLMDNISENYLQDLIDTQNKQSSLAYYQTGYNYYQAGLQAKASYQIEEIIFEKALLFIEKSIKSRSDFYDAWYVKGIIEFKLKRYDSTIESCNEAVKINNYAQAWFYQAKAFRILAQQQENKGYFDRAIFCYKTAIYLQPKLREVLQEYGLLLYQLGDYKQAISVFNNYIDINPNDEAIWFAKGRSFFDLKLYKESVNCFNEVIKLNKNNYNAWLLKGKASSKIWDIETAIYSFYQAIKINPNILSIILYFLIKYAQKYFKKIVIKIYRKISHIAFQLSFLLFRKNP